MFQTPPPIPNTQATYKKSKTTEQHTSTHKKGFRPLRASLILYALSLIAALVTVLVYFATL